MKNSTIFERRLLFVDTWGWLALADSKDRAHEAAVGVRRSFSRQGQSVTTDYVLDETITRLFSRQPFPIARQFFDVILEAERAGQLVVERLSAERFEKAYALRLRYRDKPRISFTDLTSFVVMHERGIRYAITQDKHFQQIQRAVEILP